MAREIDVEITISRNPDGTIARILDMISKDPQEKYFNDINRRTNDKGDHLSLTHSYNCGLITNINKYEILEDRIDSSFIHEILKDARLRLADNFIRSLKSLGLEDEWIRERLNHITVTEL